MCWMSRNSGSVTLLEPYKGLVEKQFNRLINTAGFRAVFLASIWPQNPFTFETFWKPPPPKNYWTLYWIISKVSPQAREDRDKQLLKKHKKLHITGDSAPLTVTPEQHSWQIPPLRRTVSSLQGMDCYRTWKPEKFPDWETIETADGLEYTDKKNNSKPVSTFRYVTDWASKAY